MIISHNRADVRQLCDEAYVLYAGQILERAPTNDLFDYPLHPYTKGLIASLPNVADSHTVRLSSIPGHLPDMTDVGTGCIFAPRCKFAVADCFVTSQILFDSGGGRAVRCQRTVELAQRPWNSSHQPRAQITGKVRVEGKPILQAITVKKVFSQGRLWDSLKLNLPGRGRPIITYEPRTLAAVDGVTMDIYPGEIVGLVGESGSGKSTLGRCFIRLLDTTSGGILFDGKQISNCKKSEIGPLRRDAQIVFQNPDSSLNPRKRVRDIIERPLELFKLVDEDDIEDRTQELLTMVNLPAAYAGRYPHQLSGGEKQRVGIARALATEPRFIVCDEAVSALDVSVQATIINLFLDLRDKLGLSILFISHDLSVVAHIADRIAVMYRGKICEIGPASEVLHPPYHPYTHALLSAVPQLALAPGGVARVRLPVVPDSQVMSDENCNFRARCPYKLGDVCDTSMPHSLQPGSRHDIFCHHQLEDLVNFESITSTNSTRIDNV